MAERPRRRPPLPALENLEPDRLLSAREARESLPYTISGGAFRHRVRRTSPFAPVSELGEAGQRLFRVSELLRFIRDVPMARERRPNLISSGEVVPDCPLEALPGHRLLGMGASGHYLGLTRAAVWSRLKKQTYPRMPWKKICGAWRIRADELR